MTWPEVRTLNEYGLRVTSAAVLRDPPSLAELPADLQEVTSGDASQMRLLVGLGGAMLLIITALLVGPAFAVSATRQRRTLALAASNGASTPVLRRTVLAQALVLGSASAVAGTVLGRRRHPRSFWTRSPGTAAPARRPPSTCAGGCSRASPCAPSRARWSRPSHRLAGSAGSTSSG